MDGATRFRYGQCYTVVIRNVVVTISFAGRRSQELR